MLLRDTICGIHYGILSRRSAPASPPFLIEEEMAFDQQKFNRAHDRYLEPPDENFDEEGNECDLADIERQKRIDKEDWLAETLRQKQEDEE